MFPIDVGLGSLKGSNWGMSEFLIEFIYWLNLRFSSSELNILIKIFDLSDFLFELIVRLIYIEKVAHK